MAWDVQIGQIITFLMMAVALGMDAFSLGIGIGMKKLSFFEISKISTTIGIFHIIMPLIGIMAGHYLLDRIGHIASVIGGGLLIYLGANMLWSAIFGKEAQGIAHTSGVGLFMLAFSVSLDALSVGFSLGLFSVHLWMAIVLFGMVGGMMTWLGLAFGKKLGNVVGDYGEAFGGVILLVFGIKFLV